MSTLPANLRYLASLLASGDLHRREAAAATPAVEWSTLAHDASRHGLSAAVTRAIHARPEVPASVRVDLQAAALEQGSRALRGLSQLLQIVETLDRRGIRSVALKGPALSLWLYGDAGFRRFGDLDVLVASEDHADAFAVLRTLGYRLAEPMSVKTAAAIYGALGAWPLRRDDGHPVDLHWRTADARFPQPLTAGDVIAHCVPLEIAGRVVCVPKPTHAAILTLLHAAKHLWCTLEMILAVATLMRRADVDWTEVRRSARRAHAWHASAAGLRLASELLDAPVPAPIASERWPTATDALCAEAIAALTLAEGEFADRWIERRAHRAAFDRSRDRLRYDAWRFIGPTPLEWHWRPLPDALTPFYVPLRIVRLGVAALSGALRSRPRG